MKVLKGGVLTLTNSQRQTADKLIFRDHPVTEFIMVFEILGRTHSVLEDSHADFVENFLKCGVISSLEEITKVKE